MVIFLLELKGDGHSPPQCEGAGHLPLKVKGVAIPSLLKLTGDGNSPPQCVGDDHSLLHKERGRQPALQVERDDHHPSQWERLDVHLPLNALLVFRLLAPSL